MITPSYLEDHCNPHHCVLTGKKQGLEVWGEVSGEAVSQKNVLDKATHIIKFIKSWLLNM